MSNRNDELERLQRLRERQLSARDPRAKERRTQRKVAARRRKLRKRLTLKDILLDIPYKWQGVIIGAIIGVIISIVLTLTVESSWVELLGLLAVLFIAMIGFVIGQALDAREELKDLMRD
jgi:uncharacterized protein YacL